MKKKLIIYGAGGLGREVLTLVRLLEEWEIVGFLDDGTEKDSFVKNVKILGGVAFLADLTSTTYVVIAIGDPAVKKQIVKKITSAYVRYPVLIHPSAILQDASSIQLGEGTIVTAGTVLTTDIQIGNHVLINLNTTIGHDTRIGNYSSIMPGVNIAGEVNIGEGVLVGSGANILNRVRVGDQSKIGMGTVVIRNVEANITVAGVPARPIKTYSS